MKKLSTLCLAGLLLGASLNGGMIENWASYVWTKQDQTPTSLRVLIVQNKPGVVLEVKGKYKLYDPNNMEHISTRFLGKRKFLQPLSNGIKWGEEFPGVFQILIKPDEPGSTILVDGVEYRGNVYVYDVAGQISIVNEVNIENYIDSILAAKFDQPLPSEYLSAITIAKRTQAYYYKQNPKTQFWSVDGAKSGYEGYAVTVKGKDIEKALATTRNLIMLKDNQPFDANWDLAKIKPADAEKLARKGETASQILEKAFPGITIKAL